MYLKKTETVTNYQLNNRCLTTNINYNTSFFFGEESVFEKTLRPLKNTFGLYSTSSDMISTVSGYVIYICTISKLNLLNTINYNSLIH